MGGVFFSVNNMPGLDPADVNEEEGKTSQNIIALVSQFADDNLTFVRNISTGLALAGFLIIARSIRLITKFGSAADIPARFIERNISIRGRVRNVSEKGLEVEHIPIYVPLLSPLLTKPGQSVTLLDVRLAGVELTSEGQHWIGQHLKPAEIVWLRLIARQDETLHCLVSVNRGSLLSTCVNEELLRHGLARTCPLVGLEPHSRIYWRLYKRLLRAESRAEKKGKGFWKEESRWERVTYVLRNNTVVMSIKRLFKWTSGSSKE
ncbi:protein C3orf33 homolog isoform X2 [Myxocyprinus asiaticus]|uniref:protein C3orf33 homolog isoform X2 n=1 Tax=Myxocyprinus asiaticus TaxID=70543 RepID=UPI0022213937|nr:protein C3orf33 homolog isoform X2 [Myxocyprinus asiaticus]